MRKRNREVRCTLTDLTYETLEKFAKKLGVPKAFIVRVAIKRYLSVKGAFTNENH